MFSDDLDKALATFVLANGAAATGKPVTIFFTFWGLNVLKKEQKPRVAKDFFGAMVRQNAACKLPTTGPVQTQHGRHGRPHDAPASCAASTSTRSRPCASRPSTPAYSSSPARCAMDVMGVRREELWDEVTLGGVATYMERGRKRERQPLYLTLPTVNHSKPHR